MIALGGFKTDQQRADFKRMMIDAQCSEERYKREALKSKNKDKDER